MVGDAAGCVNVGVRRIEVPAGGWSTPAHEHGREEEIFYVLGGRGISWQAGETAEISAGDCIVYQPRRGAHTVHAFEPLDVLAFGERSARREPSASRASGLVRRQPHRRLVAWRDQRRLDAVRPRGAARTAPAPAWSQRHGHATIVNVEDVEAVTVERPRVVRTRRNLGAGSRVDHDGHSARRGRARQGGGAAPLPLARGGDLRDPRWRRRARPRRRGDDLYAPDT